MLTDTYTCRKTTPATANSGRFLQPSTAPETAHNFQFIFSQLTERLMGRHQLKLDIKAWGIWGWTLIPIDGWPQKQKNYLPLLNVMSPVRSKPNAVMQIWVELLPLKLAAGKTKNLLQFFSIGSMCCHFSIFHLFLVLKLLPPTYVGSSLQRIYETLRK